MKNTDGLFEDSPAQDRYAVRLARALSMLAVGAMMHLPSATGSNMLPPAVSPRPFVRVAAQQADSTEAPGVIVAHSLVFATFPAHEGVLQANDALREPVGTAGLDEAVHAVALADVQPSYGTSAPVVTDDRKTDSAEPASSAETSKRVQPEKPLPAVAAPANDPPPQTAQTTPIPALNPIAPPATYRVPPIVSATRTVSEEDLVRQLLDEYTEAFERRDVRAAKALYPNVDGKALKRAYEQIASQRLTLESCGITISGSTANARCRGSATFQPRIGTRPVQIASREWTFDLSKQDTAWRIVNTYVR
jgi:hypothetical protein